MVQFPDKLEYNYADYFKKEIANLFVENDSICLDLKNIERASLSCIQVLIAAEHKAEKENVKFVIEPSDTLKKILNDLGLEISQLKKGMHK